jgi:hypothetical protein
MQPGGTQVPESQSPETRPVPSTSDAPDSPTGATADDSWQFVGGGADTSPVLPPKPVVAVSWTSSEYVAHDKNAGWYALVALGTAVLATVVYFVTEGDIISTVVMGIVGLTFAVFGARKPQVLAYAIDGAGIQIGNKHYAFGAYRTFSVIEEDSIRSILLMPIQRFNLPLAIYYGPSDEEKIIQTLATYLPHEDRKISPIDNLMRKIRF